MSIGKICILHKNKAPIWCCKMPLLDNIFLCIPFLKPNVTPIISRNATWLLETYPCQVADIEPEAAAVVVDVVSHVEGPGVVGR